MPSFLLIAQFCLQKVVAHTILEQFFDSKNLHNSYAWIGQGSCYLTKYIEAQPFFNPGAECLVDALISLDNLTPAVDFKRFQGSFHFPSLFGNCVMMIIDSTALPHTTVRCHNGSHSNNHNDHPNLWSFHRALMIAGWMTSWLGIMYEYQLFIN